MQDFLSQLENTIRENQAVIYTALVETRGSTPQKAGATMLVFPDGSQAGTLGGGCVEAEVKRRALRVLRDNGPREIMTFQLDNNYGWDDGLICGGRMKMLVDPVPSPANNDYLRCYVDALKSGRGCTEAVMLEPEEFAATRFLLDESGLLIASRGTHVVADTAETSAESSSPSDTNSLNALPEQLLANLRPVSERPRPYVADGISYLPYLKHCRLLIVGAGHVGQKVAELADDVGFDVWVADDRSQYCNADRFPRAQRLLVGPIPESLQDLQIDSDTMCVIVTRGHNHDEEALFHLAESSARYVGMIGSRRKIRLIFDDLLKEGISQDALDRVHAPLGFEIGSQTVPEIAISIVAELIACRNLAPADRASVLRDSAEERR